MSALRLPKDEPLGQSLITAIHGGPRGRFPPLSENGKEGVDGSNPAGGFH
jgi:hypothetical protein